MNKISNIQLNAIAFSGGTKKKSTAKKVLYPITTLAIIGGGAFIATKRKNKIADYVKKIKQQINKATMTKKETDFNKVKEEVNKTKPSFDKVKQEFYEMKRNLLKDDEIKLRSEVIKNPKLLYTELIEASRNKKDGLFELNKIIKNLNKEFSLLTKKEKRSSLRNELNSYIKHKQTALQNEQVELLAKDIKELIQANSPFNKIKPKNYKAEPVNEIFDNINSHLFYMNEIDKGLFIEFTKKSTNPIFKFLGEFAEKRVLLNTNSKKTIDLPKEILTNSEKIKNYLKDTQKYKALQKAKKELN